jgi:glycosyltransferase involved in cell wall biosynthesis
MINKNDTVVVYIITKLELGGAQKVCLSLFNGLQQAGKTTLLISGSQGKLVESIERSSRVMLIDEFKREVSIGSLINEIKTFFKLIVQLKKLKTQFPRLIVHTHSTKAGLLGRWAAFFAGIKQRVHTVHGFGFHPHQSLMAWSSAYILELVTSFITTHYICVSVQDAQIGAKFFPRFSTKNSLIRAAVDMQKFYVPAQFERPFPQQTDPFIFGTVSCFKKQKNLFDLLKAFDKVRQHNSNVRLEIIGDGVLRTQLEDWITQHNLQNFVTLHGWQDDVASFMLNWHAFVLSSLWEGLPCSVVEARLMKLPVLSYNTGGIPEIINSGTNGFLYPQGHWYELADGMLALTQQQHLYNKLRSFKEDLHDFNNSAMVEKHLELYNSLS